MNGRERSRSRGRRTGRGRKRSRTEQGDEQENQRESVNDCETATCSRGESAKKRQRIMGREQEFDQLTKIIEAALDRGHSQAIYIAGCPGTGKTLTVNSVIDNIRSSSRWSNLCSVTVNCVSIKSMTELCSTVLTACSLDTSRQPISRFYTLLQSLHRPVVIVLDEMDHLQEKNHALLYAAYDWTMHSSTRIILIGIANSLDLTERIVPKLKLSTNTTLINFKPYTNDQLMDIINQRIQMMYKNRIDAKAVELCARKVAAQRGDIRHAFAVLDRVLGRSPLSDQCQRPQMNGTVNAMMEAMRGDAVQLPIRARVLLGVLLRLRLLQKRALTIARLASAYENAAGQLGLPHLSREELDEALLILDHQGLLQLRSSTISIRSEGQSLQPLIDITPQLVGIDSIVL